MGIIDKVKLFFGRTKREQMHAAAKLRPAYGQPIVCKKKVEEIKALDAEMAVTVYNNQLAIRKQKSQRKNWGKWK